MDIRVQLADKIRLRGIVEFPEAVVESTEYRGIKKESERIWRKELNRSYRPLKFPICCEYCVFVRERMWHCGNPKSAQNYLNVMPNNVCPHWLPNQGLMMFLHRQYLKKELNK
ncbi:hypothetical protein J4217_01675 [Candidatus Pacearchaeota archaeon]|nr:hypothetical protein [Candidatus Pacearchaeota archaeon]